MSEHEKNNENTTDPAVELCQIPGRPFPSLLNNDNIPCQLFVNCLKLVVFEEIHEKIVNVTVEVREELALMSLKDIELGIADLLRESQDYYATSLQQIIKDVRAMIGSFSIPWISKGIGCSNIHTKVSIGSGFFRCPKQYILWMLNSTIRNKYRFECDDSKYSLEISIQQESYSMEFWEILELEESKLIEIEDKFCCIINEYSVDTENYAHIAKGMEEVVRNMIFTQGGIDNLCDNMVKFIFKDDGFRNRDYIEGKLKKSYQAASKKFEFVHTIIKECCLLHTIVDKVLQLDVLQSYRESKEKTEPLMTVFRIGGEKQPSLKSTEQYFVFRAEVDLTITVIQKKNDNANWKSSFKQDNGSMIYYVPYSEGLSTIEQHTGQKDIRSHLMDEPEIGYYSCPPIISPMNILCKPAHIVIRDIFNLLFYELNIFNSIHDEHIADIRKFVQLCIFYLKSSDQMYCLSFDEIERLLEQGRSRYFEGRRDATITTRPYVLTDEDRGKLSIEDIKKKLKSSIKPGTLKYYEQTIDEMTTNNLSITPQYSYNDIAYVAFVREHEELCFLTHSQDACATVGRCALRFITNHKFRSSDYCENAGEKVAVKNMKYFGSYCLTALRTILFKECYDSLPNELTNQLEQPEQSLTINEFETLIMKYEQHFTPAIENMYCESLQKMLSIFELIILQSTTACRMTKSITPLCQLSENERNVLPPSVPKFPSIIYEAMIPIRESKPPIVKKLIMFELDKLAYIGRNTVLILDDLTNYYKQIQKILHTLHKDFETRADKIMDQFWKKKKFNENVEAILERLFETIFGEYDYPMKQSIIDEIREMVMTADDHRESVDGILSSHHFIKDIINGIANRHMILPAVSYLDREPSILPEPKLLVHSFVHSYPALTNIEIFDTSVVFTEDIELIRMIEAKKDGIFDRKSAAKKFKVNSSTFSYISYVEAVEQLKNKGEEVPIPHSTKELLYGYRNCTPLMSPTNQPCQPAHFILRKLFNFLNLELNIFRSIREEHFDDVRLFIDQFITQFDLLRNERLCISCQEFEAFLEKGRHYFSTMMDENIVKLQVPQMGYTKSEVSDALSILRKNVKPGLFRTYDKMFSEMESELVLLQDEKLSWFTIAIDAVYRGFVTEYAGVAYLIHSQKQCQGEWSQCTLKFVNQKDMKECSLNTVSPFSGFEDHYTYKTPKSSMPKLPKKLKTSIFKKKLVKTDSQPAPIDVPCSSTSQQSNSSREASIKLKVSRKSRKRNSLVPETETVLYNSNIITTCLKMILDNTCYQRVIKRIKSKLPAQKQWMEWKGVLKVMENVENMIPSFDAVMEDIKSLRQIRGSSIFFDNRGCLDFQYPCVWNISEEIREISELKQTWLRSLPIVEHFYQRKIDKISKILLEYQLDKLAASIGATEIVTIKCPQYVISNWIIMMREELRKERCEKAMKFVEKEIDKIDPNKDMINQLIEILLGCTDIDTADRMEKIMKKEYETCKCKLIYVIQFLFKIHTTKRIVDALCTTDSDDITKRYDKDSITHTPKVRAERNGKLIFVEELQLAIDVAKRLNTDKMITDIDLPIDDNNGENTVESFNYISKSKLHSIGSPAGIVKFKDISVKANVILPILSSKYTMCIEASTILRKILDILTELKVFESLDANNIDTLTIFIDDLMAYFKPEIKSTFCLDYKTAMELLKETRKKFENMRPRHSNKKDTIDAAIDKRLLKNFGAMLSSISCTNLSKREMEDLIDMADIRALLFEYTELAIAYHNQGMCNHDGKLAYCPLDYFDKNDKDLVYQLPEKCDCTRADTIDRFKEKMKEMRITRMVKCVVPNSKNKLERKQEHEMEQLELEKDQKKSLSISTQTDETLDTIQKKLDLLESDVRRLELDKFDLKRDINQLDQAKKVAETKLSSSQSAFEKKERYMSKEIEQLKKIVDDCQRKSKQAEGDLEEQKNLVEEWKRQYKKVIGSNKPSTSTEEYVENGQTVEYYMEYIAKGTNLIEDAETELNKFLSMSDVNSDNRRAKIEMENFKIKTESLIRMAQFNLELLENDDEVEVGELLKLTPFPGPFSQQTNHKMALAQERRNDEENPKCNICDQKLSTKLFKCWLCTYRCDLDCFKTWAIDNPSCPQCRQKDEAFIKRRYDDQFPEPM